MKRRTFLGTVAAGAMCGAAAPPLRLAMAAYFVRFQASCSCPGAPARPGPSACQAATAGFHRICVLGGILSTRPPTMSTAAGSSRVTDSEGSGRSFVVPSSA